MANDDTASVSSVQFDTIPKKRLKLCLSSQSDKFFRFLIVDLSVTVAAAITKSKQM